MRHTDTNRTRGRASLMPVRSAGWPRFAAGEREVVVGVQVFEPFEVATLLNDGAITIEKNSRATHRTIDARTFVTTRSGDSPFMQRWSIGHSRSIQGRHQTS